MQQFHRRRPQHSRGTRPPHKERGYVLITMMLFVALLAIAALAVATKADFQSRRDREEELVHRGVQYARAVRLFFKKTGRYPTRVEELENTNNLRFLRKRYKDPVTGEDFKLLRMGDVKLTFGQGIAGAMNPAAIAAAQGGQGMAAAQAGQALAAAAAATGQSSVPGAAPVGQQNPTDQPGNDSADTKADKPSMGGFSGPVFGGGPIVGVASKSTKESIREFNKKNHYDQWQFIYDPSSDRGGLLNTPAQPPLQGSAGVPAGMGLGGPGQPGAPPGMNPTPPPPGNAPPAQPHPQNDAPDQ
jgi:hypothetical protein